MSEYIQSNLSLGGNSALANSIAPQVYGVTHEGNNRLPSMRRSFISFSYGGKLIEDFGFIAITTENKISRTLYAPFEDNVTLSSVFDGQIYWDTHFQANTLMLSLITDGIPERTFENFKQWFRPGVIRELVLMLHPNRAILARVSEVPELGLLPFEGEEVVKIANNERRVKTTLYKGTINLTFTMDDPYWYSLNNILDLTVITQNNHPVYQIGQWTDVNGALVPIMNSDDALKIIMEDGVPTVVMAGSAIIPITEELLAQGELLADEPEIAANLDRLILFGLKTKVLVDRNYLSTVDYAKVDLSRINVFDTTSNNMGENDTEFNFTNITLFNVNNSTYNVYMYYPGTAPCLPIMSFTMKPFINSSGYIAVPYNNLANVNENEVTISFKSVNTYEFKFTTPSIWTGYNQAIKIFYDNMNNNISWEDLRKLIRNNVKHFAPRDYAIGIIDYLQTRENNEIASTYTQGDMADLDVAIQEMKKFLTNDNIPFSATFTFDSLTGRALGKFVYKIRAAETFITDGSNSINNGVAYIDDTDNICTIAFNLEEDVGDMMKSSYLRLEDKNIPTSDGYIDLWDQDHPTNSYIISQSSTQNLENFELIYKYRYL